MIMILVEYIWANGRSSSSLKVLQIKKFSRSIGQTLNIQPPKTAATLPISFPIHIALYIQQGYGWKRKTLKFQEYMNL